MRGRSSTTRSIEHCSIEGRKTERPGIAGALSLHERRYVRALAGLRAERQLDPVALLVVTQGLRRALELVRRSVGALHRDHAVLLIDLFHPTLDLLGGLRLRRAG